MKKEKDKIELVVPAGGWEHLKAALNGGADSVYLGYTSFGARAYAPNFDLSMLKKAAILASRRKAKIYLTLNTLIKDEEILEAARFLNYYSNICQDGIIIQDLGIYKLIKDLFPHLRLHASTQMNIHNLDSVLMLQGMGIKRVVLAREMTLNQIRHIAENSDIELEVFGHGSQCYSFSGHCYLSSLASGRSGNRGRCSQPCRMRYRLLSKDNDRFHVENKKHLYYFSKKDLSAIEILPKLIGSGVDAIKIEGRMKTPEYVGIVTKIYRKYIDSYYADQDNYVVDPKDIYKLKQIFLREAGLGYFNKTFPQKIINPKTSGSIGNFAGRIEDIEYSKRKKRVEAIVISGKIPIGSGDLLEVWTNKGNERITVKKAQVLVKKKNKVNYRIEVDKPLQVSENDRVFKYFDQKLDGEAKSLYLYDSNRLKVKKDQEQADLKEYELRYYMSSYFLDDPMIDKNSTKKIDISASVYDLKGIQAAADSGAVNIIYYGKPHQELIALKDYCKKNGANLFMNLPRITYDKDLGKLCRELDHLAGKGFSNFEVSSMAGLNYVLRLKGAERDMIIGRDLNVFNTLSASFISDMAQDIKISEMELPVELNIEEAAKLNKRFKKREEIRLSMFGYGFFPVMAARFKLDMLTDGYKKGKAYYAEDIKGYKFRLDSDIWGNILVFNSKKLCNFFDLDKLIGRGPDILRLDLRFMDAKSQKKIIGSYKKALGLLAEKGIESYRGYSNYLKDDILFKDYTRGHLLRGVK